MTQLLSGLVTLGSPWQPLLSNIWPGRKRHARLGYHDGIWPTTWSPSGSICCPPGSPRSSGLSSYLYTNLSTLYERAGRLVGKKGFRPKFRSSPMPEDDITHPIPDLTGWPSPNIRLFCPGDLYNSATAHRSSSSSRLKDKGSGWGEDFGKTMRRLHEPALCGLRSRETSQKNWL